MRRRCACVTQDRSTSGVRTNRGRLERVLPWCSWGLVAPRRSSYLSARRIHPPATDEIGHGGGDAIGLLDDQEVSGARDIDDLHPLAHLIPKGMSITWQGGYVIEPLDYQERSVAARLPFVLLYASASCQVSDMDLRPALH